MFGEVKTKYAFDDGADTYTEKNDHVGWTAGAGLEYAWGNWLVGVSTITMTSATRSMAASRMLPQSIPSIRRM